jgi:hypothetical protein
MQNQDLIKFTAMLIEVGELYGKSITELLTDLYWQALNRFEFSAVKLALSAHINDPNHGQYFPKPADVVRFIEGSGEVKALQAWAKVYKAIVHIGAYQSVVFDDPLIHAVLEDLGGWLKLCATNTKELPFRANEFQQRYMMFVDQNPIRYPKYCYGITETVNAINGYATDQKLFIGELNKAEQVMKHGNSVALLINTKSGL